MKTDYPRVCLVTLAVAGLTACGGGGGGVGVTVTPFTSWSAVLPGSTVAASGDSQQGTYSYNTGTGRITATTVDVQQSGATFTERFSATSPYLAQTVRFQTASGTDISFTRGVDTFGYLNINTYFWFVESADGTRNAIMADPVQTGWEYQSFGIWTTGVDTGSGTHGAASAGLPTPAGPVPTTRSATFFSGRRLGGVPLPLPPRSRHPVLPLFLATQADAMWKAMAPTITPSRQCRLRQTLPHVS